MVQEKNIKKINYKLIKSTASELFLQKGYGNTSMNDIAVHLNIKKASLYHHIKSRSQLVLDIVNDLERKLFEIFNRLQSLTDFNEQKKLFLDTAKCFYIDTEHSYLILICIATRQTPL